MYKFSFSVLGIIIATSAANAHSIQTHHHMVIQNSAITISCYRGPWKDVIWDRPNPEFLDSLVAAGYTLSTAHAIAERICRDPNLVDNPAGRRSKMQQILSETPFDGQARR